MSSFDAIGGETFGTGGMRGVQAYRPRLVGESAPGQGDGEATDGFAGALGDALARVDALQTDARLTAEDLAMGKPVEISDLMVSMGKSEIAFNLMLEVRNKIVDAWDRLSRSVV